jgi:hypothetical protein
LASIIKADTLQSTTANVSILNSSGTEYARFDSDGDLGIGTASPADKLHIAFSSGSLGGIRVQNTNASGQAALSYYNDAGTQKADVWWNNSGSILYLRTLSTDPMIFSTNNSERMRVNAGAPILCLSGGSTTATGTGIAFPATQSASTDANTLDDYEEGTWSPTFSGTTIAGTGTFTINSASYTKIGRYVYCQIFISFTSTHTGTGGLKVGGFPFNVAAGYGGGGQVSGYKGNWGGAGPDFCQMEDSTNFGYLRYATATAMADLAPNTTISNGTYFMMAFTYHAST